MNTTTLNIKEVFPKDWLSNKGGGDIYISAYHCLTNIFDKSQKPYYIGEVLDAKYLIVKTEYQYQEIVTEFNGIEGGIPQFKSEIKSKTTKETPIIMFLLKHAGFTESEVLHQLQASRGLMTLIEGENSHYWHLTDRVVHFPKENDSVLGKSQKSPEKSIAFLNSIRVDNFSKSIQQLDEGLRNKIYLALRWIDGAKHEQNSLDEFLKLWFAIETLIMPDTSNIKPIREFLENAYSFNSDTVNSTFNIGKIFNLRSKIVHDGANIGIHSQLIEYLKALIYDYLCYLCKSSFESKALGVINNKEYPAYEWMP